jgi:integrase
MTTYRINFTKAALDKITPPKLPKSKTSKGGIYDTYCDTREKGLVLIVSNGGAKTYYLYGKINGRPERVKLAPYTDISIEQARKKCAQCRGQIANGANPQQARRSLREELTFREFFHEYMERYSKPNKKSWKFDEREVNKFLSHWFNRKLSTITKQDVQKLHEKLFEENGLYQANRVLERVRAMYNKAIEWGWQGVNPSLGIKKYKEKSRDRFITGVELPRFFEALEKEENHVARDFFKIALLTGARKTNVLQMRWEHIDFHHEIWHIPETKNGEPHKVALSSQALAILNRRKKKTKSEWVFEGEGKEGHFTDPKKAWARILERAKIDDLHIHDLRRTLGSWQAATGANGFVIGKTLGHKSPLSTQVYARLDLDPVRLSVEKATDMMLTLGGSKNGA